MTMLILTKFLKWCIILNGGLLIFASLFVRFGRDWMFALHSHWIPLSQEGFNVALYLLMGIFKLLIIVFNVVPYAALVIIGKKQ